MSKAVKSVGKAVGKVVGGVAKVVGSVVKGVGKVVSKVAKSPIGKILLAAGTIYFGGAALMGGMQGAAAGSGFWGTIQGAVTGAGAGLQSAWSGLTGALSGGGMSSLTQGFTGAGQAGASAVSGITSAGAGATQGAAAMANSAAQGAAAAAAPGAGTAGAALGDAAIYAQMGEGAAAAASKGGILSTVKGAWAGLDPLSKYGLIQAGTQVGGSLISGIGQEQALEDQRNYTEQQAADQRARYNANMGAQVIKPADGGAAIAQPGVQPATEAEQKYAPLYDPGSTFVVQNNGGGLLRQAFK